MIFEVTADVSPEELTFFKLNNVFGEVTSTSFPYSSVIAKSKTNLRFCL